MKTKKESSTGAIRPQTPESEAERHFRLLAENVGEVFWLASPDQRKVYYINPAFDRIWGRSREEFKQNPFVWLESIHPEDRPRIAAEAARDTGAPFTRQYRIVRPDGSIRWILARGFSVRDDAGKITHIVGLAQDITETVRIQTELRESEARYRAIVEDQTEIISRINADGVITFVNEVFCRFFGKTAAELLGKRWQPNAVPEDIPGVEEKLKAMSPARPVVIIENRVYSGSGKIHWMQFVNRGFFDARGKLLEIQSVGRDITDLKRAEDAAREAERRLLVQHTALEQKNAALRELLEQMGAEKDRIHENIAANIEDVVIPLLQKLRLKGASRNYLRLLEHHLRDLTSAYSVRHARRKTSRLTPREGEICTMIKARMSSKDIAKTLGVSCQTVQKHRRNIRKRLHLTGKKQNLTSFLAES